MLKNRRSNSEHSWGKKILAHVYHYISKTLFSYSPGIFGFVSTAFPPLFFLTHSQSPLLQRHLATSSEHSPRRGRMSVIAFVGGDKQKEGKEMRVK